jgi:hypothetical protein
MPKHAELQSRVTERLPAAALPPQPGFVDDRGLPAGGNAAEGRSGLLDLAYPPPPTAPGSFGGSAAHASAPCRGNGVGQRAPAPDPRSPQGPASWLSFVKSIRLSRGRPASRR